MRNPRRTVRTLAAAAVLAVLVAGCQQARRTTGTDVRSVTIVDAEGGIYAYSPKTLSIASDRITEVTWTNDTEVIHALRLVFLNRAGRVVRRETTASIAPGDSLTHTFSGGNSGNLRGGVTRVSVTERRGPSGGHVERGDIDVVATP